MSDNARQAGKQGTPGTDVSARWLTTAGSLAAAYDCVVIALDVAVEKSYHNATERREAMSTLCTALVLIGADETHLHDALLRQAAAKRARRRSR